MPRILIIDDDLMLAQLLGEHLSNEGYDVHLASMAEDGFKEALKNPPDLIFLDVNLPDATGFQMCGRFREHPKTQAIPIIMMTGAARWPNQQAIGRQMGANEYILKPFDVIQVGDRVHALMGSKRPRQAPHLSKESESSPMQAETDQTFAYAAEPEVTETPEQTIPLQPEPISEPAVSVTFEEERYFEFSVDVLILVSRLPKTRAGRHLADQLLQCGTAVGAKIQELRSVESEQETHDILHLTLKKVRETAYWLMLIRRGEILDTPALASLEKQCEELAKQLVSKNQPVS